MAQEEFEKFPTEAKPKAQAKNVIKPAEGYFNPPAERPVKLEYKPDPIDIKVDEMIQRFRKKG